MNSKIMKVKYLLLSLVMGAMTLASASAQEETTAPENQLPAYKTAFESSPGHWFIELQAGVTAQFLNANEKVPFLDRVSKRLPEAIMPTLSIGKWHNPYFATRLQLMSGLTPTAIETTLLKADAAEKPADAYKLEDIMFMGAHFDFMFDVVNFFAPYSESRVFHLIPFAGVGYAFKSKGFYKFDKPYRHSLTANLGLQMAFHLGKRVDLILEGQGIYSNLNLYKGDFVNCDDNQPLLLAGKNGYNGLMAMLTAGLRFNLGETEWKSVTPMDYDMINGLNDQINALRAENAELSKRPEFCPECPEVEPMKEVEVVNVLAPHSILFGFDKATISPKQEYKLAEIAQFVKETNVPVLVLGYADTTGDANYNMDLSQRRAQAVADALINKYGVSSDMVTVEANGETDMHSQKAWNRVVIVRSK